MLHLMTKREEKNRDDKVCTIGGSIQNLVFVLHSVVHCVGDSVGHYVGHSVGLVSPVRGFLERGVL